MKPPSCRVLCVGEISQGGKQFLYSLQTSDLIELDFEPSAQKFTESPALPKIQVIALENRPESRGVITKLRAQNRRAFIIWFGRNFVREDLEFALEHRVFWTFENLTTDKRTTEGLKRLLRNVDHAAQFDQLIRSLKGLILQEDTAEKATPLLAELKTAIAKLERLGTHNEFLGSASDLAATSDAKLPFYKSQGLADALNTIHDLERTGELWVRGQLPHEEGKVEFLQGRIVYVEVSRVHGVKALHRMFLWDNPRFLFNRKDPKESLLEEQLTTSIRMLVAQGESFKARFDKVRKELPPPHLSLTLEPSSLHSSTALAPHEFSTLASVIEFGEVSQVMDYNQLPDVDLYEALIKLRRTNVIKVAAA